MRRAEKKKGGGRSSSAVFSCDSHKLQNKIHVDTIRLQIHSISLVLVLFVSHKTNPNERFRHHLWSHKKLIQDKTN